MEIVKSSPYSVPSRNIWKYDKLGVGEACVYTFKELEGLGMMDPIGSLRASAYYHARSNRKKFSVQTNRFEEKVFCYRIR